MSKLTGVVGGPALGAAAAAALVLAVALIIGPGTPPDVPETAPSGLVSSAPEQSTSSQDVAPDGEAKQAGNAAPEDASPAADEAEPAVEPEAPAQTTAETTPVTPDPPSIDTFRLDPDGALLLAGQSTPGWDTVVTLDGEALETVSPDNAGKFVVFLTIDQSDQPRILALLMRDPESGEEIASRDEVIIAPTPAQTPAQSTVAALEESTQSTDENSGTAETGEEAPPQDTIAATATEPAAAIDTAETGTGISDPPTDTPSTQQTVLLSNDEGVRVLQPATPRDVAPEVMSSVALDAITYDPAGEVELSGRGQGKGFIRVYLDNAPVTTLRVAEDGNWRTTLPMVDTGVYTLRIDETDADGNVTSRVETPFKREEADVVMAAAVTEQRIAAVTVQPGSTLWAISRAAYGEGVLYVRVFEANRDRIRDPDLIYPGQVFSLPE